MPLNYEQSISMPRHHIDRRLPEIGVVYKRGDKAVKRAEEDGLLSSLLGEGPGSISQDTYNRVIIERQGVQVGPVLKRVKKKQPDYVHGMWANAKRPKNKHPAKGESHGSLKRQLAAVRLELHDKPDDWGALAEEESLQAKLRGKNAHESNTGLFGGSHIFEFCAVAVRSMYPWHLRCSILVQKFGLNCWNYLGALHDYFTLFGCDVWARAPDLMTCCVAQVCDQLGEFRWIQDLTEHCSGLWGGAHIGTNPKTKLPWTSAELAKLLPDGPGYVIFEGTQMICPNALLYLEGKAENCEYCGIELQVTGNKTKFHDLPVGDDQQVEPPVCRPVHEFVRSDDEKKSDNEYVQPSNWAFPRVVKIFERKIAGFFEFVTGAFGLIDDTLSGNSFASRVGRCDFVDGVMPTNEVMLKAYNKLNQSDAMTLDVVEWKVVADHDERVVINKPNRLEKANVTIVECVRSEFERTLLGFTYGTIGGTCLVGAGLGAYRFTKFWKLVSVLGLIFGWFALKRIYKLQCERCLRFCPHLVSCAKKGIDFGSDFMLVKAKISSLLRRPSSLNIPAKWSDIIDTGSALVVLMDLPNFQ